MLRELTTGARRLTAATAETLTVATKTKKKAKVDWATIALAMIKAIDNLAAEVKKGTAEMKSYRRMVQNPGIELADSPSRGIPEGALLETDRMRRAADNEE